MKHRRPHCSLMPDLEIPTPKLKLFRHFLMEEGMETVEEGFTVSVKNECEGVLFSNFRGTELTKDEEKKYGWEQTTEDVLHRSLDELKGVKDPAVEALKFLLNVIEHQERVIQELTNRNKG